MQYHFSHYISLYSVNVQISTKIRMYFQTTYELCRPSLFLYNLDFCRKFQIEIKNVEKQNVYTRKLESIFQKFFINFISERLIFRQHSVQICCDSHVLYCLQPCEYTQMPYLCCLSVLKEKKERKE